MLQFEAEAYYDHEKALSQDRESVSVRLIPVVVNEVFVSKALCFGPLPPKKGPTYVNCASHKCPPLFGFLIDCFAGS
jgi:hypothetical protein